jgi:hypothetical protein
MADLRTLVRDEMERAGSPSYSFDDLGRRRDRKRRNQRIAAGVVGIAVFVAAIWVVTTGLPFDQSQTEFVPGGAGTGPAETGPTGTPTAAPDPGWDGLGIPPEGVALSTPAEGKLIGQFAELHVGFLFVYADGRVIWHPDLAEGPFERRLTPEGVELVRSGAVAPRALFPPNFDDVPAGAWADAEIMLYAPPRYAICLDASRSVSLLPAPARDLLRGKEHTYEGAGPIDAFFEGNVNGDDFDPSTECFELTTGEARALDQILSDAGLQRHTAADSGDVWFVLHDGSERVGIGFNPLFPDGLWHYMGG